MYNILLINKRLQLISKPGMAKAAALPDESPCGSMM